MIEDQEQRELEQALEALKQSDRRFDILDVLMRYPDATTDYASLFQQRKEAEAHHLHLCKWFAERGLRVKWNVELSRYEAVDREKDNISQMSKPPSPP
ncbi:MAG: hypothetical protein ACRDIV_05815 [Ktedonobacteraceae bacterium]